MTFFSLHVIYQYKLSAQQLTQQMVGEYLMFFQNNTRSKFSITKNLIRQQFSDTTVTLYWL